MKTLACDFSIFGNTLLTSKKPLITIKNKKIKITKWNLVREIVQEIFVILKNSGRKLPLPKFPRKKPPQISAPIPIAATDLLQNSQLTVTIFSFLMVSFLTGYYLLPSVLNRNNTNSKNNNLNTNNNRNSDNNDNNSSNKNNNRPLISFKKKLKYKIEHNFFYLPVGSKLICIKDYPEIKLFSGMKAIVIEKLKTGEAIVEISSELVSPAFF